MKQILVVILFSLILISACSSPKNQLSKTNNSTVAFLQPEIKTLSLKGSIDMESNGKGNSGEFKLQISGRDSLSLIIYGPFSIVVGKLFACSDKFLFYNVFNNEAAEGIPSRDYLEKTMNIPMSFESLVKAFRNEVPEDGDNYKLSKTDSVLVSFEGKFKDYSSICSFTGKENLYRHYTRFDKDSKISVEISYEDYFGIKTFNFPKKMIFEFPGINSKIIIEIEEVKINETLTTPLSFKIPENVKRLK
jgi:hypothetical protein